MKTILVTGGAGFIGSNFIHYVLAQHQDLAIVNLDKLTYAGNLDNLRDVEQNARYRFVRGDICDAATVDDLMAQADYVVNFAAETHVDRSILDAGDFIQTDVYGTFVLLEAARKHKIKKFIQISTDEVYGEAFQGRPSLEDDPLYPKSPYAASKAGADRLVFSYWTTYGLPVLVTRCSNNFGPYQYPEKMIPLFVTNVLEGKQMPIYGDGKNTRDWIYVTDHCQALVRLLLESDDFGETFNIGAATEKSIIDIADIILDELGKDQAHKTFVPDRLGHVMRHAVNTDKIRKRMGWQAQTAFEQALRRTIRWYADNGWWWQKIKHTDATYKQYYNKQYGTDTQ